MVSKPEWVDDYLDYDDLVKSWGYPIIARKSFGGYQGDLAYILKNDNRHGLLVIGYGSCSGCDALQSVIPWWRGEEEETDWQDVIDLANGLKKDIDWADSPQALLDKYNSTPENEWWSFHEEMNNWVHTRLKEIV